MPADHMQASADPGRAPPRPGSRFAAVLLAAGSSTRFGAANKLLADVGGKPLVRRSAEALAAVPVDELIVVTGPDAEAIEAALAGLPARFVHNPRHAEGQGGSVAAGIAALGAEIEGAIVTPADMPELEPALVARLIAAFQSALAARTGDDASPIVCAATADGAQRNPVLWPRRLFPALAALSGPAGAKGLIAAHGPAVVLVRVTDPRSFTDIDTTAELEAWRTRQGGDRRGSRP